MARRWNDATRAWVYDGLCFRDGEWCQACGQRPTQLNHPLEIDELNCHKTDHDKYNLQLLCRSCNVARSNHRRALDRKFPLNGSKCPVDPSKFPADGPYGPPHFCGRTANAPLVNSLTGEVFPCPCVCEIRERHFMARKQAAHYAVGSAEMRANLGFEKDFREWLTDQVKGRGHIPWHEARDSGAEVIGCSPATTERYLAKLTSPSGDLEKSVDMFQMPVVMFKDRSGAVDETQEPAEEIEESEPASGLLKVSRLWRR